MAPEEVVIEQSSPAIVEVVEPVVQVVQIVERGPRGPVGPVANQDSILEFVDIAVQDYFVLHPQSFVYQRSDPATTWTIVHPLDHRPQVTVMDTAGDILEGVESYPASNVVQVDFNQPVAGTATLS